MEGAIGRECATECYCWLVGMRAGRAIVGQFDTEQN